MTDSKENMRLEQIMEIDELAGLPVVESWHKTPRTSMAVDELKPTPYADLRALAGLIRKTSTPLQKHPAAVESAHSTSHEHPHTPLSQPWTTPRIRRPLQQIGPGGSKPTTPHTIRALQQRRATPGQSRRKSGRTQRETPRDALRNLSKILAGSTQPFEPSSNTASAASGTLKRQSEVDFEDELSPDQPQFSIAVDQDEESEEGGDGSSLLSRPRLSIPVEEEEHTLKSIEKARRGSRNDEQQEFWKMRSGSLLAGEYIERSMELERDDSKEAIGEHRPWQEDESISLADGDSAADFRHLVRHSSKQRDQSSNNSPGQLALPAEFSPFVFEIPQPTPQDSFEQSATSYEDLIAEDIRQFGSPLPFADASQQQLQKSFLQNFAQRKPPKAKAKARARRASKVSRHGTSYSDLPAGIVKSISVAFARSTGKKTARLGKESVQAVLDASEKFFEQLSGDLAAASSHAGRKMIDDSDVLAVMRRQRQFSVRASVFSTGVKYLPIETVDEVRIPFPQPHRSRKAGNRFQGMPGEQ